MAGYFLLRLVLVDLFELVVVLAGAVVGCGDGVGSGSNGAGGGVVSMVQPIQPEITKTNSTNSNTGIPTAHFSHSAGNPM